MTGLQTIGILALALVASIVVNLYQWRQSAVADAVHEVTTEVVTGANDAANEAVTAVVEDRETCQRRLTMQHDSLSQTIERAQTQQAAARRKAARLAKALAQIRQTPECQAWAARPSCGVGVWQRGTTEGEP